MISTIISRLVILVFGTLYPAYASYKAVKTKNIREYVKWMMYWIVFAIFTAAETFADVFISWIPFYYELKIIFVFWLLSPATRGSSILYRNFVHPRLMRYEPEIDRCITTATEKGYSGMMEVTSKGVEIVKQAVITAALKGQTTLVTQLSAIERTRSRSASLSDVRGGGDPIIDDFEALGPDLVNGVNHPHGDQNQNARRITRRQRQVDSSNTSNSNIEKSGQALVLLKNTSKSNPSLLPRPCYQNELDDNATNTKNNNSLGSSSTAHASFNISSMLYPSLAKGTPGGAQLTNVNVERVALWLAEKTSASASRVTELDNATKEDTNNECKHRRQPNNNRTNVPCLAEEDEMGDDVDGTLDRRHQAYSSRMSSSMHNIKSDY